MFWLITDARQSDEISRILRVFKKYTNVSFCNICLNLPSKKINPRENSLEVEVEVAI